MSLLPVPLSPSLFLKLCNTTSVSLALKACIFDIRPESGHGTALLFVRKGSYFMYASKVVEISLVAASGRRRVVYSSVVKTAR